MKREIRILIVDDHPVVRAGLRTVSEVDRRLVVIGEAGTLIQARAAFETLSPDVVLLDVRLADGSGVALCAELKHKSPNTKVVFLTSFADNELVLAAMEAGGDGYLLKGCDQEEIAAAIHSVMQGGVVFDPSMARDAVRAGAMSRTHWDLLSPQETRVLCEVAAGKTDKEVAQVLGLSAKTVRNYLDRVFEKLQVSTRTEAAVKWLKRP